MRRNRARDLVSSIPRRRRRRRCRRRPRRVQSPRFVLPVKLQPTLPGNIIHLKYIFRFLNLGIKKYSAILNNVQLSTNVSSSKVQ